LRPQNYDFQHDGGDTYQKVDGPKDMKLKDFYEVIRKKFKDGALPKDFQLYYMDRQQMMMSADRYKVNCVLSGEDDLVSEIFIHCFKAFKKNQIYYQQNSCSRCKSSFSSKDSIGKRKGILHELKNLLL
jgi:hypothetical protein